MTYDWTSTGTSTPAGGPAVKPGRVAAETPAEPATPDNVSVAAIVEEFRTPPTERIGAWDRDGGPSMREQAANWRDAAGAAWSESSFVRERREQRSADGDGDGDVVSRGTVLGLRPERILSIALRAILVIFLLLALLSLAESLLVPA